MMKIALCIAVAGLAAAANADIITASAFGPSVEAPVYSQALGDTTNVVNGVFNAGGGAILNDSLHTIGGSDPMNNVFQRSTTITSTVSTVGNIRTVVMTWETIGQNMLQPGDALGGTPITQLSFENGSANAGGNGINDPQFLAFNHAPDPATPGTFLAGFELLGAGGSVIFAGTYFVSLNDPTEISGRTFIGAGGADLAGFSINGGRATVSYLIPSPTSAAVLGFAGLAAARRRR
jgi:hypothetical protein